MIAFKFLRSGSVGPFSGVAWPKPSERSPAEWVVADGPLEPCRRGIHACRLHDLPAWIDEELWLIELSEPAIERDSMVLAERGRLRGQVIGWTSVTARELAEHCVARAERFADDAVPEHAETAKALAADCAALLRGRRPDEWGVTESGPPIAPAAIAANLAFVVAHAAGAGAQAARPGIDGAYGEGFAAERAWQVSWLADRLGLADST